MSAGGGLFGFMVMQMCSKNHQSMIYDSAMEKFLGICSYKRTPKLVSLDIKVTV